MHDRIELQIPEFAFSLKKKAGLKRQFYGLRKKSDGQEIRLKFTFADQHVNVYVIEAYGFRVSAEIDLKNRKIVFIRQGTDHGEFREVVGRLLGEVQLYAGSDKMHFIAGLKKQPKKPPKKYKKP